MNYALTVAITALLVASTMITAYNEIVREHTGATLAELVTMKQECEAKLPRNKVCEMYFEYMPERE